MTKTQVFRLFTVLLLVLTAGLGGPIWAQTRTTAPSPVLVLTQIRAPQGNAAASSAVAALTRELFLFLSLSTDYTVHEADFIAPTLSIDRAQLYYQKVGARIAVFGTMTSTELGDFSVRLSVWDNRMGTPKTSTLTEAVPSANPSHAVVNLIDKLMKSIGAGTASVATVEMIKSTQLKKFAIYVDGVLAARNRSAILVPAGDRRVMVAIPGSLGDQPFFSSPVHLSSGQTKRIEISTAPKSPNTVRGGSSLGSSAVSAGPTSAGAARSTGGLSISSTPSGAEVYLNGEKVGITPFERLSVPVGTYRIDIKKLYFKPNSMVVTVKNGSKNAREAKLQVDTNEAAVAAAMHSPKKSGIAALTWTAVQAAYAILGIAEAPSYLYAGLDAYRPLYNLPAFLDYSTSLLYFRIGQQIGGNAGGAAIIDIIGGATALTVGLLRAMSLPPASQTGVDVTNIRNNTLGLPLMVLETGVFLGSTIYDVAFAGTAATNYNQTVIETLQRTGQLPTPAVIHPHAIVVETGGKSLLRVGYRFSLIPNILALEPTAGISLESTNPFKAAASAVVRLAWSPYGVSSGRVRPVVNLEAGTDTDLSQIGFYAGIGPGMDILLKHFDMFARSDFILQLSGGVMPASNALTVGIRL